MLTAIKTTFGALLLIVGLLPAQTAGPVQKVGGYWVQELGGSVAAPLRLTVSVTGDIRVRGADVDRVSYRVVRKVKASSAEEARSHFERAALTISRRGPAATLTLANPACGRCAFTAEIEIEAPRELRETVLTTRAGAVDVVGVSGGVSVDSAAGSITLDAIGGGVRASTGGGPIKLGVIGGAVRCDNAAGSIALEKSGGDATLTSNGGRIDVGSVGGTLRAETMGGGIEAENVSGSVIVSTFGGDIRIGTAGAEVIADTAGGSIEVGQAQRGVRVETLNGRIRLSDVSGRVYASSASGGVQAYFLSNLMDSLIETTAGSIVVWLPADIRVAIDAQVDFARGSGRIESDFPGIVVSEARDTFGPRELRAVGELNGGGPTLVIRNTSGKIQIRRRQ